jgi:superfamily I DNA/RNA helicase
MLSSDAAPQLTQFIMQLTRLVIAAAAGIASPIVLLMGAHRLIEAEDSLRISAGERAERVRDNTRRLYMAMTRAGQRLVMTYVGTPPAALVV